MSTAITVTSKHQITLPIAVCRRLGIDRGDRLEVDCTDREIRLRPARRFQPVTRRSFLFRTLGRGASDGGHGARDHDRILADESGRREDR